MNVTSLMRRAAEIHARRIAIVHDDDRITFAEAWERGCRFANGLMSMGLKPGDCVAALEENSRQAADFFLGCAIANIVRVPLYPRNSRESHIEMLCNTDCRALFASADHASDVAGLEHEVPTLEHVSVRGDKYEDWLAGQPATDPLPMINSDDLYIIRHTGGTTGRSRGVASTHKQWIDTGRDWFYAFPPVEPGDACLHVGPISHGSGYFFMPTWLGGGANVMVAKFEPKETLEIMERERVGYSFIVPPILNALCQHPSVAERDWSALKCLFIAGAPISDANALKAREVFGEHGMYQSYGLSEVLLVSCMGATAVVRRG
ncbi:MAG: class I adenylate-forming enzyme family protein [Hyphomicrobiaceae bacterium]